MTKYEIVRSTGNSYDREKVGVGEFDGKHAIQINYEWFVCDTWKQAERIADELRINPK